MKISLKWLNDYIETGLSAEKIAEILSNLGFPCEGIEKLEDDSVIDIEVTSNRGDCLSFIGIARELAAFTGDELKIPQVEMPESDKAVTEFASVEISEPELCHRYTARIIEGVKVGPSPVWLKERLEALGMRSVNNVVDATNYAMLESGQPPHAFDYDKLAQGKIVVRKAIVGERLISIDGSKCELGPEMLVIADSERPVAIAGVMGGLETEVSESTTRILLEDAHFEPVTVRTAARKLSLPSEAAFRFERIVDAKNIDWASMRTAQLITQVAGGKVVQGVIDVYPKKAERKQVSLRPERLNKLLGIEVAREEVMRILSGLRFEPQLEDGKVVCTVPSWRSDVYREADLIEEVSRVYGYDKIPVENKISIEVVTEDSHQKLLRTIGGYLNSCGFYETVNVTFTDDSVAGLFADGGSVKHLAVTDVFRKNANVLRRSLIGSLLGVLKTNLNAKNSPCRIFEVADTFVPDTKSGDGLPIERTKIALVCDDGFRELKGVVVGLISRLSKYSSVDFRPAKLVWAEVGAEIVVDKKVIGTAGIVGKKVKEKFDFKDATPCCGELDFDLLANLQQEDLKFKPIARYPAIERDFSLVVDECVNWESVAGAIGQEDIKELEEVKFVEIYRGEGIGQGKKSVTLSVRFRDEDGTLTHEQVDIFEQAILDRLSRCTGAKLRSA